ncbi:MAG: trimeric intracellular cation channel family protein [Spirochaetes bacterium]|nr:trimeric intracellular cation channel family protein [Spirochaetota bacterium]
MSFYFLDLFGTFAFAITGAYKAKIAKLNIFGVIFLGIITAIGGGTIRDIIMGRTPLFYLKDPNYFLIAMVGSLVTYFMPTFFKKNYSLFRFVDSIGLSIFTIVGVSVSFFHLSNLINYTEPYILFFPCVFLGMLTGFGGGVIRDSIMGGVPLSLKNSSNYTLSAFFGSSVFYVLMFYFYNVAIIASITLTLILREMISPFGMYKKVFKGKIF